VTEPYEPEYADPDWDLIVNRIACRVLGHEAARGVVETVNRRVYSYHECTRCRGVLAGNAPPLDEYMKDLYPVESFAGIYRQTSPFRAALRH
jgi:hypothetical protein